MLTSNPMCVVDVEVREAIGKVSEINSLKGKEMQKSVKLSHLIQHIIVTNNPAFNAIRSKIVSLGIENKIT